MFIRPAIIDYMQLSNKRVLCVGAGGLGAVALYTLAGCGVGSITIADGDVVKAQNLDRQILFDTTMIGFNKAQAAAARLSKLYPNAVFHAVCHHVTENNVEAVLKGHDLVLAAVDSLQARLLLNRACVHAGIPLVSGGVDGPSGVLQVVMPNTPCLSCVYGDISDLMAEPVSDPPVVALVSAWMAQLAISVLLTNVSPVNDDLLMYDATTVSLTRVPIKRNPFCRVCLCQPEKSL